MNKSINDWREVALEEVALEEKGSIRRGPFGGSLKKEIFVTKGYKVYEQKNAIYNDFELGKYFIDEDKYEELIAFSVKPGDILISCAGTLGRVAIAPRDAKPGIINQALTRIRPNPRIVSTAYLKYFLQSPEIQRDFFGDASGSAIKNVKAISELKSARFLLPPLSEQKRIADILDKADAIRRKRQEAISSLLSIPGSAFHAMFGTPSHNTKGWQIGTIRDLVEEVKYGSSRKAGSVGEFPMLRMNNITYEGIWEFSDLKYIDLSENDRPKYLARKGDILFNRTNSKELVGKTAVFQEETPMAFAGYLVRARTNELAHPDFIAGYLNSPHGKATLRHMCKNIVGMANINAQEFQNIAIPHPPIEAQLDYVQLLDGVRTAEKPLRRALNEAEALFNSLVQRAFKGEL